MRAWAAFSLESTRGKYNINVKQEGTVKEVEWPFIFSASTWLKLYYIYFTNTALVLSMSLSVILLALCHLHKTTLVTDAAVVAHM